MRIRPLPGPSVLAASFFVLAVPACGDQECMLLGCVDRTIVTLPGGLVSGPYDLVVMSLQETLTARCLDPGAPETMNNPPGLECDAAGFTLEDHPLARERSVRVTVVDVATDELLVDGVEVTTVVTEEMRPNGVGCPPTCYVRNGAVLLPGT